MQSANTNFIQFILSGLVERKYKIFMHTKFSFGVSLLKYEKCIQDSTNFAHLYYTVCFLIEH